MSSTASLNTLSQGHKTYYDSILAIVAEAERSVLEGTNLFVNNSDFNGKSIRTEIAYFASQYQLTQEQAASDLRFVINKNAKSAFDHIAARWNRSSKILDHFEAFVSSRYWSGLFQQDIISADPEVQALTEEYLLGTAPIGIIRYIQSALVAKQFSIRICMCLDRICVELVRCAVEGALETTREKLNFLKQLGPWPTLTNGLKLSRCLLQTCPTGDTKKCYIERCKFLIQTAFSYIETYKVGSRDSVSSEDGPPKPPQCEMVYRHDHLPHTPRPVDAAQTRLPSKHNSSDTSPITKKQKLVIPASPPAYVSDDDSANEDDSRYFIARSFDSRMVASFAQSTQRPSLIKQLDQLARGRDHTDSSTQTDVCISHLENLDNSNFSTAFRRIYPCRPTLEHTLMAGVIALPRILKLVHALQESHVIVPGNVSEIPCVIDLPRDLNIQSFIACPLLHESSTVGILSPCGHLVSAKAIGELVRVATRVRDSVKCPICLKEVQQGGFRRVSVE